MTLDLGRSASLDAMTLSLDDGHGRLVVTIRGFVGVDEIVLSKAMMIDAIAQLTRHRSHFDCMVIQEGAGPAPKDGTKHLRTIMTTLRASGLRKMAHVGFSPLSRLQLQRLIPAGDQFAFFQTRAEAERWFSE